jgi:hypothetical protein
MVILIEDKKSDGTAEEYKKKIYHETHEKNEKGRGNLKQVDRSLAPYFLVFFLSFFSCVSWLKAFFLGGLGG